VGIAFARVAKNSHGLERNVMKKITRKQYIARAREIHQDDDCEIDDNARLSKPEGGDEGAWVQAWVWVADSDFEG